MADRIVVAVMGTSNSGKSTTWNTLFDAIKEGGAVRTGKYERHLYLNAAERVDVFLVSGSAEERDIFIGDILPRPLPKIVLCSLQYRQEAKRTIDFFANNQFDFFVVWLNPGYGGEGRRLDDLNLVEYLLEKGACVVERSAKDDPASRCFEIKQFLYGWARVHNLVTTEF